MIRETDDIWRLYVREWIIVNTVSVSDASEEALRAAADGWVKENLTGRVRPEEVQLDVHFDGLRQHWAYVMLFKDNLKGEFKHRQAAETFAESMDVSEYVIVQRNSRQDHAIRSYGVKLL